MKTTTAASTEKKTLIQGKIGVNSLSFQQLEDIINYCKNSYVRSGPMAGRKMLQTIGGNGTEIYPHGQVIYMTNFMSTTYPRIHIPNSLWNSWETKPPAQNFLFHLVFWRWINGGRECDLNPNKHISHLICYRGPDPLLSSENFLLLREEDRVVNESRKPCWDKHVELDFLAKGKCPHKPHCILLDWDFPIERDTD